VKLKLQLVMALGVIAAGLVSAAPGAAKGPPLGIEFRGQAIVPTGTTFAGTTIGGLSSITYDPALGVYYTVSDDPGTFGGKSRFYTLRLDLADGHLSSGDVHFDSVTTLLAPDGQPYAPTAIDPEGLVLTKERELILTSEGYANAVPPVDPFVRRYSLGATWLGSLPVPQPFLPTTTHTSGIRNNLAFESAGVSNNGRFFFTGIENALFQDGPAATALNGSPSRIMRYDLQTGVLDRQWIYMTDPVVQAPAPGQFSVNGLVELLPLNNEFLIAMERSFTVGVPGTGNSIKLYRVSLPGATDVNGADSIAALLGVARPAQKTLLLDLDTLGIPLDNVEGLTFGPTLPDGHRSLVLVSDNNFAASQFTQFLLFEIE
jgi:hypothetical protein